MPRNLNAIKNLLNEMLIEVQTRLSHYSNIESAAVDEDGNYYWDKLYETYALESLQIINRMIAKDSNDLTNGAQASETAFSTLTINDLPEMTKTYLLEKNFRGEEPINQPAVIMKILNSNLKQNNLLVKELLQNKLNLDIPERDGASIIAWATFDALLNINFSTFENLFGIFRLLSLIEASASLEYRSYSQSQSFTNMTPLALAVYRQKLIFVKFLVHLGANIETLSVLDNCNNNTLLHLAFKHIYHDSPTLVDFLIRQGVRVNIENSNYQLAQAIDNSTQYGTADDLVVLKKMVDILTEAQDLFEYAAIPEGQDSELTKTNVLKLEQLLVKGNFPDPRNHKGQTPLHIAAIHNNLDAMILLIRHGASLLLKDDGNLWLNKQPKKPLDCVADSKILSEVLQEIPRNEMIKLKDIYQINYNKTAIFFRQIIWKSDNKELVENCLTVTAPLILQFLGNPFHSKNNPIDYQTSSRSMKSNKIKEVIEQNYNKIKV